MRQRLQAQELLFGLFCSSPCPTTVELIAAAGYDLAILDTEHTLVNPETLQHCIRAADAAGLATLVRVPDAERWHITRALDAGAHGVLVADVRHPEQVAAAVDASRYTPEGSRGLNATRSARHGAENLAAQLSRANAAVIVAALVEHAEGVRRVDELVRVPGLDLILEGAADLSQSLAVPWRTRDPDVRAALERVQAACYGAGVAFAAAPRAREDAISWHRCGVRVFVLGDDRGIIRRALTDHLQTHREGLVC